MEKLFPQKGKRVRVPVLPIKIVANFAITSMVLVVMLADLTTWIYQEVFFTTYHIPKIPRKKYIRMTRHTVPGLNIFQRWSCWYCEYTNSIILWIKAVANQTEIYSCGIKYSHQLPGMEYQTEFYERDEAKELLQKVTA